MPDDLAKEPEDCVKKFITTTTNGFKMAPLYCASVAVFGWVVLIAFKGGEYYLKSDWDAFGPISNILLASVLVIVTFHYARIQTKFTKIDRISKEIDILVSPLNSMNDTALMFTFESTNKVPNNGNIRDNAYYEFWTGINQNKYLGPLYLRSAIDDYLLKSNSEQSPTEEEIKKTCESVKDAAKKRYGKLDNEISILAGGSTMDKVVAIGVTICVFFVVFKMWGWL